MLLHNLIILIRHSAIDREACSASLLSSQGHQLSNVRKIVELVNSKPNISQKMKYTGCNFILIMEHEIKSRDDYLLLITRQVHKVEQKLFVLWESFKLMGVYHDSVIFCLTSIYVFRRWDELIIFRFRNLDMLKLMFKNHCSVSYKSVTIYFNNIQVQFKFKFSRHTKFNRFIMYSLRIQYLPSKIIHFSSMRLLLPWK